MPQCSVEFKSKMTGVIRSRRFYGCSIICGRLIANRVGTLVERIVPFRSGYSGSMRSFRRAGASYQTAIETVIYANSRQCCFWCLGCDADADLHADAGGCRVSLRRILALARIRRAACQVSVLVQPPMCHACLCVTIRGLHQGLRVWLVPPSRGAAA